MTRELSTISRLPESAAARLRGTQAPPSGHRGNTWQAIRDQILGRIRSGEWPPGSLVPAEMQLAVDWGCARATVNRAMRDLAESGIVERRRRLGTRVNQRLSLGASREISPLRSEIRATGAEYGYKLLQLDHEGADHETARILKLRDGDPVSHVSALYLADRAVYCAEETWLNRERMTGLKDSDLVKSSAGEFLAHNAQATRFRVAILAACVSAPCAEAMGVTPGTVLLTIERTEWADAIPLAFSRQYFPVGHRMVYDEQN
ncbi:GntR family transcriptional regulator [Paracoccus tegillarcae]|uniref:UbiC family transcriptional regulator n=1 Tax=Paracoccus tegillarcae TaxID=1529068 RepID=A0A2K9F3C7_9RHOB|nr:GntR family transcriptional regulator [Paracoccus tegillarcae]AUH33621.1 UbiC family transcriptional regulator [Paracoccus tegillarcae]